MAQIQQTRLFRGFNTIGTKRSHNFVLYDIDLVNRDLSNAFNTRVGERVMRPTYGCAIWDYLLEPFNGSLRDQIVAEVIRICELDSRLVVLDTQVSEYEQGIRVQMTLQYRPFNVVQTFTQDFETRQTALTDPTTSGSF
jgi:phage baseplate assembly protein W